MSKLISGKEALIALANGEEVEAKHPHDNWFKSWTLLNNIGGKIFLSSMLNDDGYSFRLKPRTIAINGIEIPAPFEPKSMEDFYVIDGTHSQGWINGNPANPSLSMGSPKWRTEGEIKQVVAALRSIFKPQ